MQQTPSVRPSVAAHPPGGYALHLQEEAAQCRRAFADGIFHQAWAKADRTGVDVVLEAESVEGAAALLADLSLTKARYAGLQIVALDPFSSEPLRGRALGVLAV